MTAARRTLIGKRDDEAAWSKAMVGWEPIPDRVITSGILHCVDLEFIGIDEPDAEGVNLTAPEPVEGQVEGWLYFRDVPWAAYTEDLVAVIVQRSSH